jgi:phosphate starvation-inducible PhoH-like protein
MVVHVERHGKLNEDIMERIVVGELDNRGGDKEHKNVIVYGNNGHIVRARTDNQQQMVTECDKNDMLFAIGPAGTGKTYTAVALAVRALKEKSVRKIILTRPAVEAGENLGFLPGDLKEKIDPYLRPLYDALEDMIPMDKLAYYMQNRIIEVAPLAFMRGRTLDYSFILLDEAQNATTMQLKMFLTRIGPSSKCIITGDPTQIDLPRTQESGLGVALRILANINGISTIRLNDSDVVRHRLVREIIKAYDTLKSDREHQ